MENPNVTLGDGASIRSARLMIDRGVEFVLAGACHPVARSTLWAKGVKIITGCVGTAQEVLERVRAGDLKANVAGVPGLLLGLQ